VFENFGVTSVTVDGSPVSGTPMVISGRAAHFVTLAAGTHSVVVTYATPVAPVNHAPIAANDSASVTQGQSVTIPVLANDGDPDGDPLTVIAVGPDSGADLTINPDQTVTYTPHATTCGPDSFPYTISDGRGGTSSAAVSVAVTCLNGQVTQQTFADFSASCAVPTNAIVTRVGDGEVRLAGTQGDEFLQPSLNTSEWVAGMWSGGAYTPAIADSVLSLANSTGAFVRSAGALPLTSLESSTSFSAQPWEHVGWGSLDFTAGYVLFSTFNTSTNLFARTSGDGATEQRTNLGPIPTGFHTYRIDRQAASSSLDTISYYIDGTLVAQHSVSTLPSMYVYLSNNGGTQPLSIDRVWVYPAYASSGTYQSCTQDMGQTVSVWTTAAWSANVPGGATLQLSTRTSTDGTTWSAWSVPLTSSGQTMTSPPGRYLQYRLALTTSNAGVSAIVDSVTVNYAGTN
jgi:hypothetical protein